MKLSHSDLEQILKLGISQETIEKQIFSFQKGFPYIHLSRPATPGDGILSFSDVEKDGYIKYYEEHLQVIHVLKFVPASGAASRMFKHLFEFIEDNQTDPRSLPLLKSKQGFNSAYYFLTHLQEIAFFEDLRKSMISKGLSLEKAFEEKNFGKIIDFILHEKGLNYANLPKGLIKFHKDNDGARTSVEEHLVEAAAYTKDRNDIARIHFTVSPEHKNKFSEFLDSVKRKYESKYGVRFEVSFSIQSPSTDTIAVDSDNIPFRDQQNKLVFRPGGHGSLLTNLNGMEADLVFIKNIDNVVPDRIKPQTIRHKKLLGGVLLSYQNRIFKYLSILEKSQATRIQIEEMISFVKDQLLIQVPSAFHSLEMKEKSSELLKLLNRPIRVCGMVKNEDEPGGGPFWVINQEGIESLQIVESSQVNMEDASQKAILQSSTHFNPVDLVCGIKDFRGNRFDLTKFVDEETGFISNKSLFGKKLKALELPGLWNGSMANWITLFVEVPIITFNPVKSVNDLLRKEHLEY